MDIPVQYTTTADGVRIAFSIAGQGLPILYMPPIPQRHLRWELEFADEVTMLKSLENRREM